MTENIMHLSFWDGLISPNTVNSISIAFIFLHVDVFPTFAKESTFSLACSFGTLWEIWWLQSQVFISRAYGLFQWFLFLLHCLPGFVWLWFSSIFYNQILSFPHWSFCSGLHWDFPAFCASIWMLKITFSSCIKNVIGILIGIALTV